MKERHASRHNEVLQIFWKYLDQKIPDINKGKLPATGVRKKTDLHKEEKKEDLTKYNTAKVEGKRWSRSWMVSANSEYRLVFPLVATTQVT